MSTKNYQYVHCKRRDEQVWWIEPEHQLRASNNPLRVDHGPTTMFCCILVSPKWQRVIPINRFTHYVPELKTSTINNRPLRLNLVVRPEIWSSPTIGLLLKICPVCLLCLLQLTYWQVWELGWELTCDKSMLNNLIEPPQDGRLLLRCDGVRWDDLLLDASWQPLILSQSQNIHSMRETKVWQARRRKSRMTLGMKGF